MIKPIIANRIGRNFIAATMFATSVASANANSFNSNYNTNSTEVISQDAANIIRIHSFRLGTHSFEQNRKLDKNFLKYCQPNDSKKSKKETLKAIYNNFGTYGATIEIQKMIDNRFMEIFSENYIGHYSLVEKDIKNFKNAMLSFNNWKDNIFYKDLYKTELKMYKRQEFPSAELAIETVDNYISESNFFSEEDLATYKKGCESFVSMQKDKDSTLGKSDLLAYKMHLLNALAFKNYFLQNEQLIDPYLFRFYFQDSFLDGKNSPNP